MVVPAAHQSASAKAHENGIASTLPHARRFFNGLPELGKTIFRSGRSTAGQFARAATVFGTT
jgi:hypothetical protein